MIQLSLFDEINGPAMQVGGFIPAIKAALYAAAKRSTLSRDELVERMNGIAMAAGVRMTQGRAKGISRETLDKWLAAEEREHVPSLVAVHIACVALNDVGPLKAWLAAFGCGVMTAEDKKLCAYGRAVLEDKMRSKSKRRLEEELLTKLEGR